MRSNAVLVAFRGSWRIVGETESKHWRLESFLEELLIEVEGCGKDRQQGEGKRLHGGCVANHLMLDCDSVLATDTLFDVQ